MKDNVRFAVCFVAIVVLVALVEYTYGPVEQPQLPLTIRPSPADEVYLFSPTGEPSWINESVWTNAPTNGVTLYDNRFVCGCGPGTTVTVTRTQR